VLVLAGFVLVFAIGSCGKYLNSFTKSTNLCSTVEIFLKENYPLVIEYNVANLGKLQFCLAPKIKEEN
jgi:proliferating cell nuclear antigen